ncbi:MAG TPA: hypothetical protein VEC56_08275 [Candidatus Krumholzibacteria bacterium]|jgi:hypothetical protein|nr:hypothetical protein [Candidatus Krumholzibacteria bacterium]
MERCAYCGEKVGDDGLYVDDEIFCSDECMRDFGAGGAYDEEDDDDYEDDDEDEEEEESDDKDDDDDY